MQTLSPAAARNLWVGLMTVASTVTTLVLACATPFPALAALAALFVRRQEGIILMLAAWAVSQGVGFCLLGYPLSVENIGWAAALGLAAVASLLCADVAVRRLGQANTAVHLVLAYLVAFVSFKLVVLAGSVAMDSGWAAFSPDILLRQFVRYGLILGGLLAFQYVLGRSGIVRAATRAVA